MIQPLYKKGNRLAWTGYFVAFVSVILQALARGASSLPQISSLAPFASLFLLLQLVGIALIIWGCYFALKAKNRSYWWMLLIILGLFGVLGIIFVAIIFMLPDKSVAVSSVPPTPIPPQA